jgi:hypothetical protein
MSSIFNILAMHQADELREQLTASEPSNEATDADKAKETIRRVKGNDYLQAWINDNFGLTGPTYRRAIIREAERIAAESANAYPQNGKNIVAIGRIESGQLVSLETSLLA